MPDLFHLRKLAKAATPGPWFNGDRVPECAGVQVEHADIYYKDPEDGNCTVACATCNAADADYIAAANPIVVTQIIDNLEQVYCERDGLKLALRIARAEIATLRGDVEVLTARLLLAQSWIPDIEWDAYEDADSKALAANPKEQGNEG